MKLGIIGAGNMAGAVAKGVISSGTVAAQDIIISDVDSGKAAEYTALGARFTSCNADIFSGADIWILAVKPNIYPIVLKEAAAWAGNNDISGKLIITIAAGITIATVKSYFDTDIKVIRTMPNTPAIVGEGMTVLSCESPATEQDYAAAQSIFAAIGKTAEIPEKLMNSAVAVNGSSPAYVYMFIEAMADAAVAGGIPRNLAVEAAAQTVLGAAKMVLETGMHPAALKDMVCTPGGTTIAAVKTLEQMGFRGSVMMAMEACSAKAEELGK